MAQVKAALVYGVCELYEEEAEKKLAKGTLTLRERAFLEGQRFAAKHIRKTIAENVPYVPMAERPESTVETIDEDAV